MSQLHRKKTTPFSGLSGSSLRPGIVVPRLALERVPKFVDEEAEASASASNVSDEASLHADNDDSESAAAAAAAAAPRAPRHHQQTVQSSYNNTPPSGASRREVLLARLEEFFLRRHQLLLSSVFGGWKELCAWQSADEDDLLDDYNNEDEQGAEMAREDNRIGGVGEEDDTLDDDDDRTFDSFGMDDEDEDYRARSPVEELEEEEEEEEEVVEGGGEDERQRMAENDDDDDDDAMNGDDGEGSDSTWRFAVQRNGNDGEDDEAESPTFPPRAGGAATSSRLQQAGEDVLEAVRMVRDASLEKLPINGEDTANDKVREVSPSTQIKRTAPANDEAPYLVPVGTPVVGDDKTSGYALDDDNVASAQRQHIADMAMLRAENERMRILEQAREHSSKSASDVIITSEETRRAFSVAVDGLETALRSTPTPIQEGPPRGESPTFEGEALLMSTSKARGASTPAAIRAWLEAPAAAAAQSLARDDDADEHFSSVSKPQRSAESNGDDSPSAAPGSHGEDDDDDDDDGDFVDAEDGSGERAEDGAVVEMEHKKSKSKHSSSPPRDSLPDMQKNPLYNKPIQGSPSSEGKKRPPWCPPASTGSPSKTFDDLAARQQHHHHHSSPPSDQNRRNQRSLLRTISPARSSLALSFARARQSSASSGSPPRQEKRVPSSISSPPRSDEATRVSPDGASHGNVRQGGRGHDESGAGSLWRALDKAERGKMLAMQRADAAEDALARRTDELEDARSAAAAAAARADELALRVHELSSAAKNYGVSASEVDAALRRAEVAETEAMRQRDAAARATMELNRLAAAAEASAGSAPASGGGSGGGASSRVDAQSRKALSAALADTARLRTENAELRRWKESLGDRGADAASLAAELQKERAMRVRAEEVVVKLRLALENALISVPGDGSTMNESIGTMSPPALLAS